MRVSPWKKRRIEQQKRADKIPDFLVLIMNRKSDEELERIAAEGGHTRLKDIARRILTERQEQSPQGVGA